MYAENQFCWVTVQDLTEINKKLQFCILKETITIGNKVLKNTQTWISFKDNNIGTEVNKNI